MTMPDWHAPCPTAAVKDAKHSVQNNTVEVPVRLLSWSLLCAGFGSGPFSSPCLRLELGAVRVRTCSVLVLVQYLLDHGCGAGSCTVLYLLDHGGCSEGLCAAAGIERRPSGRAPCPAPPAAASRSAETPEVAPPHQHRSARAAPEHQLNSSTGAHGHTTALSPLSELGEAHLSAFMARLRLQLPLLLSRFDFRTAPRACSAFQSCSPSGQLLQW